MKKPLIAAILALFVINGAGCTGANTYIGKAIPVVKEKKRLSYSIKLKNGFTVLVTDGTREGPTSVQLWVAGGSASDPAGKQGLAHFVEHMLFAGSAEYPAGSAANILEGMGGELTANTDRDYTYLGVTLPGTGWERAVDILYKTVTAPSFDAGQVVDQRGVVALEVEQAGSEPVRALMDNLFEEAYRVHPYRNPVTGWPATIKTFTAEDAENYHKSVYIPANMTLAVAGAARPVDVKTAAEKTFGTLPPVEPKPRSNPAEPTQLSVRERNVSFPAGNTYMAMGWHVCDTSDEDVYPLEVLTAVLGQGGGSRLPVELIKRKRLVMDVTAELYALRDPGMFVIKATISDSEDAKRVRDEILKQADKLKSELISTEELSRALLGIERMQLQARDKVGGQAYGLGFWSTVYGGQNPGKHLDGIRSVTADDIRRVAQTYLGAGNYTLSVITPEKR